MIFEIHDIILHHLWKRAKRIHRKTVDNPHSTFADIYRAYRRHYAARQRYLNHKRRLSWLRFEDHMKVEADYEASQ